jgi:hypothetical protein
MYSKGPPFDGLYDERIFVTQSAVVGRMLTTSQTVASGADYTVLFDSDDTNASIGIVPLSYNPSNGRFTNISGTTISFNVSYQINFSAQNSGVRQTWIEKNGQNTLRYGQNSSHATQGQNTIVNGPACITIANTEYFSIKVFQSSGQTLNLYVNEFNNTKIQITQVQGNYIFVQ